MAIETQREGGRGQERDRETDRKRQRESRNTEIGKERERYKLGVKKTNSEKRENLISLLIGCYSQSTTA